MTKPREKTHSPQKAIDELMLSVSRVQALHVAVRLKLPDLLADGPRSSTLLASTTGVHPGALHRLLRFLAADDFVRLTEDGRFASTPLFEILTTGSQSGLRAYVLSTATRGWEVWSHLMHSVETGQPAFDRVFGENYWAEQGRNAESLSTFDAALAPGAADTGRALAKVIAPVDCVADLGCGSGALLAELLRAWPRARGIAFDSAVVLEQAQSRFVGETRVSFVQGSFFEAVPRGAGLLVLSIILHDWDDSQCLRILKNCHAAMEPGARLVIAEQVVPEDPRAAPTSAHTDLAMLLMTGGRERTLAEYRSLLERAGLRFDGVSALTTSREISAIQASRGLM